VSDSQLMRSIFTAWHEPIAAAVAGTVVPGELLAALIANESAGNANATRFEPAVFAKLCEILAGRRQVFSPPGIRRPLDARDLLPFVVSESSQLALKAAGQFFALDKFLTDAMLRIAELATSFGLTQIMGWHWIEFDRTASQRPEDQLAFTVDLLGYFASLYALDLTKDYEKVFRCWNTGRPDGQTFDPHYAANGLHRLTLYALAADADGTATA
jgi:hypothetical protein